MDRRVRWGVLGCAGIARKAAIPAVLGSRNGVLAVVAARDPARAQGLGGPLRLRPRRHDLRRPRRRPGRGRDLQSAVERPPRPRGPYGHEAQSGVLCEKPLALDAAEAASMARAAGAEGVLLMEGFMAQFHPQIEQALAIVESGGLGEVRSVHSSFTFRYARDGSSYRWSPAMGGGAFYDVGCYTVSAARLFLEAEPVCGLRPGPDRSGRRRRHRSRGRPARVPRRPLRPMRRELRVRLPEPPARRRRRGHAPPRPGLLGQGLRRRRRGRARRRRRAAGRAAGRHVPAHDRALRRRRPGPGAAPRPRRRRPGQRPGPRRLFRVHPDGRGPSLSPGLRQGGTSLGPMTSVVAAARPGRPRGLFDLQGQAGLTYYHGQNVPPRYITVTKASASEITFEIQVDFAPFRPALPSRPRRQHAESGRRLVPDAPDPGARRPTPSR
ncbi:MAG: hypothetical protein M0C28_11450 [Candidatus Moduliflexus flocculans]|nr:hypothetical protein [Candidatus Moduliflexus flocculans]